MNIITMSVDDAIERAKSMVGKPITYSLGAGGRDPHDEDPCTGFVGAREAFCDCSGFVAWCLGYDRKQPVTSYPLWGGWVNTDSMIAEAEKDVVKHPNKWFDFVFPSRGSLAVYGSYKTRDGKRKIGHVGLVVDVPEKWANTAAKYNAMRVIHCGAGNQSRFGYAVANTSGGAWYRASSNPERSYFLKYRYYAT